MTEYSVNVPVLRKALEHVTAHPEEWEQRCWAYRSACGTAYCLAGTVAVQQGHKIKWDEGGTSGSYVSTGAWIDDTAADELGLPPGSNETELLFYSGNTLRDLWSIANRLSNGEIEVPEGDLPDGS